MSAQVTEAHRELAYAILFATEDGHAGPNETAQLIADSEAKAVVEIAMVAAASADRNVSLRLENDQLRAEVKRLRSDGAASAFITMSCRASRAEADRNNLRADLDAIKAILIEEKGRAARAEMELKVSRAIVSEIWVQLGSPTYEQLKGRSIYDLIDEMKAERARLDWLEKRGPWESWNGFGETGITLRENVRAAIDAAMKEETK